MRRFLLSLELIEENERKKISIFSALALSQKLPGLTPETVFQPLLTHNLVSNRLALLFITDFSKEYLIDDSFDDLISILKRGNTEGNLLEFFPYGKRTRDDFWHHLNKEGLLQPLIKYENEKKIFEVKLKEMKFALTSQIREDVGISEVIDTVKQYVKDVKLMDIEIVQFLWVVLMDAVNCSAENQKQNANPPLHQVKKWAELLKNFCTTGKLELELMNKIQMQCSNDKNLELFPGFVSSLHEKHVLHEDTILYWFLQGSNLAIRERFVKDLQPFVKALTTDRH